MGKQESHRWPYIASLRQFSWPLPLFGRPIGVRKEKTPLYWQNDVISKLNLGATSCHSRIQWKLPVKTTELQLNPKEVWHRIWVWPKNDIMPTMQQYPHDQPLQTLIGCQLPVGNLASFWWITSSNDTAAVTSLLVICCKWHPHPLPVLLVASQWLATLIMMHQEHSFKLKQAKLLSLISAPSLCRSKTSYTIPALKISIEKHRRWDPSKSRPNVRQVEAALLTKQLFNTIKEQNVLLSG